MADRMPLVTVLLPVFNGATFLRAAIDSVLASSFEDLELLVIDDGSTDSSVAIIRSYQDPRVRLVVHELNRGLIASLNEGLDLARGRYVARMDADDIMLPERLARQVNALDNDPGLGVVATCVEFINGDGEVTGAWDTDRATISESAIRAMMPRTNCIAHPSVMLRRSTFVGMAYSPDQPNAEDWDLWMRFMSAGGRVGKVPEVLLRYRTHPSSIMAGQKAQVPLSTRLLRTRWRFLRKQPLLGLARKFDRAVWLAQSRTIAAQLMKGRMKLLARDIFRCLTYAPWQVIGERRALDRALDAWNGEHLFLFPYMCFGGAEQIHADILATVADRQPLALICGRSKDRSFEDRFRASARVVEVNRVIHHPLTRKWAARRIAERLNKAKNPSLLSSLTNLFFDVLPMLAAHVRAFHLQHAFLYQPGANKQVTSWMDRFHRVDRFIFYSSQAMNDWKRFMTAHAIPFSEEEDLVLMSNAVHRLAAPSPHGSTGVIFVGRDSPEKRLPLFLEVATRTGKAMPVRFRFTVIGPPERPDELVRFTGPIQDPGILSRLYSEHDILALTSSREGFPMVIMEALAHGLVVVSTPVGDIPNRIGPEIGCLTSTAEDAQVAVQMTDILLGLAQDRDRLERMRKKAFDHAQSEFGWTGFRERYRNLLISPAASA